TTARSPATSKQSPRRSGTAPWWLRSRPRRANFGEVGGANRSRVAPAHARQPDHLRRDGAPDPCDRDPPRGGAGAGPVRGPRFLRGRERTDVVAAEAPGRARARPMTAVDTLDATVEALCGDLTRISAPRGNQLNARSWATEAPLRMLLNNLDPEVAELPEQLI